MLIPLSYFSAQLKFSACYGEHTAITAETPLPRPRFLLPDAPPEGGKLYIASQKLPEDIREQLPPTSVILSATEGTAAELLNSLQAAFDQVEDWDHNLSSAVSAGDLRDLLDEMEAVFDAPIVMHRANFAILGCSSEVFSYPALAPLQGSHMPFEYVNALKRQPEYGAWQTCRTPFFCPCPLTDFPSLSLNLFSHGEAAYRVTVLPVRRALARRDQFLLSLCGRHLMQLLQNSVVAGRPADPSGKRKRLITLLKSAIDNEHADLLVLEQGLTALGWLPEHTYVCLSLRVASQENMSHTMELLSSQLEGQLPNSCVFEHHKRITAVVNLTLSDTAIEPLMDNCIFFLRENDLRTGVSNTFHSTRELRFACRQATIALDFAARPQAYLWVQYFRDVVLDFILEEANRELPILAICSPKILAIRAYDQDHQTDFYNTLECYIRNKFNAVQTAKELEVHRSTFLYRLDRLQTLFELNLNDLDSLLYILLSMKMLEISKTMTLRESPNS